MIRAAIQEEYSGERQLGKLMKTDTNGDMELDYLIITIVQKGIGDGQDWDCGPEEGMSSVSNAQ